MQSKYGIEIPEGSHYTVYKLTDPDRKVYIGCTGQPVKRRWQRGRGYNSNVPIRRAIDVLGWDAFEKRILCENLTREGGEKLEKWFVEYYDSMDPEKGYNRVTGGARKGSKMSDATKRVGSESKIRKYKEDPSFKKRLGEAAIRNWKDEDYRRRVCRKHRETLDNDPSVRERLREAAERKWEDPELAVKYQKGMEKRYLDHPEVREKISMQMREYLSHPENRKFATSCSRPKPVLCIETGEYYPSQKNAEETTGFYNVHKACAGRHRTCGGYHWRYLTEEEIIRYFGGA
ncbi:MAG: hypothetical protein IJI61_09120 [Oscillospiraceae bacterium]|nr:hypothetical protein [Oscillospiraceae bacterium]